MFFFLGKSRPKRLVLILPLLILIAWAVPGPRLAKAAADESILLPGSSASMITESGVWSFSSGSRSQSILLNGQSAAGGEASVLLSQSGQIFALNGSTWYAWNGSGWSATSSPISPNGASVAPGMRRFLINSQGVWGYGSVPSSHKILLNGQSAAGGEAGVLLSQNGQIFALNGSTWYMWNDSSWSRASSPISPEGTGLVPGMKRVIVTSQGVWSYDSAALSHKILLNGRSAAGGEASVLLSQSGQVLALNGSTWYAWNGSGWSVSSPPSSSPQTGAVILNPGDDLQLVVNNYPSGTYFYLNPGTYEAQHIVPKSGNSFVGALSGGSRSAILDGQGSPVIAFDTSGSGSSDVTIRNLVITRYGAQVLGEVGSAILGTNGVNWTIDNVEVSYSGTSGVGCGPGWLVTNSFIHHNTLNGIGGYQSSGMTLMNSEISDNQLARLDPDTATGYAAGIKLFQSHNVNILNNSIRDNWGVGVWCDTDCYNVWIDGNTISGNTYRGVMLEISYGGTISNNMITGNGWAAGNGGHGVFISTSENTQIYGNTIQLNSGGGVIGFEEDRGSGSQGVYTLSNLHVFGNLIDLTAGGFNGVSESRGEGSVFGLAKKNRFENNYYRLKSHTSPFLWQNRILDASEWKAAGQDVEGGF